MELQDPYCLSRDFFHGLCEEVRFHEHSRKYLSPAQYKVLKSYYRKYNEKNAEYYGHHYAQRLRHVVKLILDLPSPMVLDAGCGVGSETILFGLLGADVTGVDLSKERLNVAKARIPFYEDRYGIKLHTRFHLKNILRYYADEKFDIIWANEFISHVHPVEDFFEVAAKNLKQRGYIIICDTNGMNPYAKFSAWKAHRKGGLYSWEIDPDSLEPVPYARERLLSILQCKKLLEQCGFEICSFYSSGYSSRFPYFHKLAKNLEDVINKMPILRLLGVIYVVIGKKK